METWQMVATGLVLMVDIQLRALVLLMIENGFIKVIDNA